MTRPDNDTAILRALRSGLTSSTEIATKVNLSVAQTQIALNRMMDRGAVVRTKSGVGYEWSCK